MQRYSSWRKISTGMWDRPGDPTVYGFEELDVTETLDYLERVSAASGEHVTMTALVVHAIAKTLGRFPELNVIIIGGRVLQREHVNVFCQVAVPSDTPGTADLSGVRLEDADQMTLVEIAQRLRSKASKVRRGEDAEVERQKSLIDRIPPRLMHSALRLMDFLTFDVPVDLDAIGLHSDPFGSCMVSSIASFDLRLGFAPLVPASRVPLLLLPGVVFEAPRVVDGEIVIRKVMQTGLTCDHRAYDGYQLGCIGRTFRDYIQHPFDHLAAPETFRTPQPPTPEDRGASSATART